MKTFVYMVGHGESSKMEGNERTRGLNLKGESNSQIVAELLKDEGINILQYKPRKKRSLHPSDCRETRFLYSLFYFL